MTTVIEPGLIAMVVLTAVLALVTRHRLGRSYRHQLEDDADSHIAHHVHGRAASA